MEEVEGLVPTGGDQEVLARLPASPRTAKRLAVYISFKGKEQVVDNSADLPSKLADYGTPHMMITVSYVHFIHRFC